MEKKNSEPEQIGPIAQRVLKDIHKRMRDKSENPGDWEHVKIATTDKKTRKLI